MLKYLKEKTTQIHNELEQNNIAKKIMDHSISFHEYRELLLQNYLFYYTVESEAIKKSEVLEPAMQSFVSNNKSKHLALDLQNLGISSTKISQIQNLDFELTTESEIIGAIYVSEGSALGGMMIRKQVPKCTALSRIETHHFFNPEAANPLDRWKTFKANVESYSPKKLNQEEALKAAVKTFKLFEKSIHTAKN